MSRADSVVLFPAPDTGSPVGQATRTAFDVQMIRKSPPATVPVAVGGMRSRRSIRAGRACRGRLPLPLPRRVSDTSIRTVVSVALSLRRKSRPGTCPCRTAFAVSSAAMSVTVSFTGDA